VNAFIINNVLQSLHSHEALLAPTIISPMAQEAINTLISMVNSLPEGNPLLPFLATATPSIDVLGQFKNGQYVLDASPLYFGPGYSTMNVPHVGGVYLFEFNDLVTQYIGSAYDVKSRLLSHIMGINGHGELLYFHKEAIKNGGLPFIS
jgi:hypothetical protein